MLNNGKEFILSFALGNDMSVNGIFGLLGILERALEPRFIKQEFLAHDIRAKFAIVYKETVKKEYEAKGNTLSTDGSPSIKVESDMIMQLTPPDTLSVPTVAVLQAASQMEAPIGSEE